ncbi:MAG: type II toxin-antitoxin system RelE/ParE family toxin [bacterium]
MIYKFEFSKAFQKQVHKLDNSIAEQIKLTVDKFTNNPSYCDWIKLKGYNNLYRIRSGNYRIIFEKNNNDNTVIILFLDVKHRREVYKNI